MECNATNMNELRLRFLETMQTVESLHVNYKKIISLKKIIIKNALNFEPTL